MKNLIIKIPLYLIIALLLLNALTLFMGIRTYNRLSDEAVIAELTFEKVEEQVFRAELVIVGDPVTHNSYLIYGDQWQLDAEFLKVKYWANVLGVDALYRLDRLQGRYRDIEQQNIHLPHAHDISDGPDSYLSGFLHSWDWLILVADVEYGSSTYTTIDTDKRYIVLRTQTGLITRAMPNVGITETP